MNSKNTKSKIRLNDKEIILPENMGSLSIKDGNVYIDGEIYHGDIDRTKHKIVLVVYGSIKGDVSDVDEIEVRESVFGDIRSEGKVICGPVTGSIQAQGHVNVRGNVEGNIASAGKVTIEGDVSGTIHTVGNVYYQGKKH